ETMKANYNDEVKKFNTRRTIGVPLCIGVSGLSYLLLKKRKKREKPTFNPKNPLVLNSIDINNQNGLALQLNFNF
ncbi:MAG: hypothetical protein AAGK97_16240, partial [Bacteroidota bacterium]